MIYGYARVSTKGQAKDGNSLTQQTKALEDAGAQQIFCDSFTGTKIDRPEFDKVKAVLKSGDKLIVTKLDRFARSAAQGSVLIESLIKQGVTVHILNMGVMDDTPTGKLIRTIMLGFAEFERDMIIQRTQEGKEIARTKEGYKEGRPKLDITKADFQKILEKQKGEHLTVKECCAELGISKGTWYNLLKEYAA